MYINILKYLFLAALFVANRSTDENSGSISAGNSIDSWPQFRGPDGQGNAHGAKLALTWSEEEHVSWKFTDPGEGWSSPVVDEGRIWMTTACDSGHSLRAVCLDLKSGKLIREVEIFHLDTLRAQNSMNSYASPSPVIAEGKLFVHFGTYGTACLSSGTGTILWKRSDLKLNHEVGPGSSPAIWRDRLIIPSDGKDMQYVIALSTSTGKTVWKTERSFGGQSKPDPCWAFCTPLIVDIDNQEQAVIPGASCVCAYDPADGKELWSVNYHGWSNVPRPLYAHGLVYVCTGFGKPSLMAIRPRRRGNAWSAEVVWKIGENVPTIPSPVIIGDRIYMISDNGTGSCLDANSGRKVWVKRLGGSFAASMLNNEQCLYCFDSAGVTTIFNAGDEFKVIARNRLSSGCMASAAVSGNAMILRTKKYIYRIEN